MAARMRMTPRFLCCALLFAAVPACVDDGTDPELGEAIDDLVVSQWPDDVTIPGKATSRPVALTPWNGRLSMFYTDAAVSPGTEILWSWWDGASWSPSLTTGRFTTTRPAATTFNNRLTMVYRPSGQNGLVMTSTGTLTWTAPVAAGRSLAIGNYAATNPSLLEYGGKLYLAYCANNGASSYVNVDRYDGTSWAAYRQIPVSYVGSTYCQSALIAAMPDTGEVEVIWNTVWNASNGIIYNPVYRQRGTIGRSTSVWYSTETLPMKSSRPLSVVTCNGNTHLVHGGWTNDTELWWSYRSGGAWVTDAKIPNQWSAAGATLGCLNGTYPLMVHNVSGGTQLMQSLFAP